MQDPENIQFEMPEIERVAEEISGSEDHHNEHYQQALQEIIEAIGNAHFEELTDEMWSSLENTDSYRYVRSGHMEDAQKFAERPTHNRDWRGYLDRIQNGAPLYAPIILVKKDGVPHLVAGNTRLMIARALGAKAKVLIARLKDPERS